MKQIKTIFIIFTISQLLLVNDLYAQTSLSVENLAEVNIDQLSDLQINSFWQKAVQQGLTIDKLEQMAKEKQMDPNSFAKLKSRIEKLSLKKDFESTEIETKVDNDTLASDTKDKTNKIFGSELFSNKRLTFEPNTKIATPPNYQIGPDDELLIEIFGYSDASFKLKVNQNGQIRIPNVGMVPLSGLTMDQAKRKIIQALSSNYSSIASGQTQVNVALGNIRSIQVTIIGEVSLPGNYTLSSLSTVFNALYASGGPNKNGSFRKIKLIRGGKLFAQLDIYDFLVKGETKGNLSLRDQDLIKVEPYEARVELKGEFKRNGIYEVKENETLADVIKFAGGFSDKAYRDRIKIIRTTSLEKSIADVVAEKFSTFKMQNGDILQVGELLDRFTNRVEIRGAVFRPGIFSLDSGLTIQGLINKAEGLKEDAFMSRGIIYRLKEDNTGEVISFDLNEIMANQNDIQLKREDIIEINSKLDLKESYYLTIAGEVLRPRNYPYAENARVEDLIVAAGGLKENASRKKIEIARRGNLKGAMNTNTQIITYEVNEDLKVNSDVYLEPFDIVTVYSLPGYSPQRNITLEGEVSFPGQYTLATQKDRISDVINRSGGVTDYANIEGAMLIRTKKMSKTELILQKLKIDAFVKQTKDTARAEEIANELKQNTSVVGINLKEILAKPGGRGDIYMEDGDIIQVPRQSQTVKVSGEVLYPVQIAYHKGHGLRKYINGAGGFTERGLRRKTYVVYANGSAEGTSKVLLVFNNYPKLKPGAEIIVPVKEERRRMSAGEIAAITSSFATIILLIYTISAAK